MKKPIRIIAILLALVFCLTTTCAAVNPLPYPKFKAWNPTTAAPLAGGKLYSYNPGTDTPKNTYSDSGLTTANTNPVILNAYGEANVYLSGSTKLVLKTSADVSVWTMDSVTTPNDYFIDAAAYGSNQAGIEAAKTAIGSNNRTLNLSAATWAITGDMTIPSNITLRMDQGAVLAISTGKTVTINSPLEAGPYQIFSCTGTGKVVYKARKYPEWWGAKDDSGTTNNSAPIAAAVLNGGVTEFLAPNSGFYECVTGIPVSVAGTRLISLSNAEIKMDAVLTTMFTVTASDVQFRRLTLTGLDTTLTDLYGQKAAIHVTGTKTGIYSNIIVTDCNISGFQIGVCAPFTNLKAKDNYIYNVGAGIVGGHNSWTPTEQNLTGVLYYELVNNNILCEFGTQTLSRPIALPLFTGGGHIQGNKLRGGGMAIEGALESATASLAPYSVLGNDCDTSISATNGGVVGYNTVDLSKAPAGRGQHPNFWQAIETGYNSTVIGNIVRNHINGVGHVMPNQRIIGNAFEDCGEQVGGPGVGLGFVIGIGPGMGDLLGETVFNTIISDNTFKGTKGSVADIAINWTGTYKMKNITISNNKSYNANWFFFLGDRLQGSKVINNTVYDAQKGDNTANAFALRSGNYSTIEYSGNVIINTLVTGYGVYQGIVPQVTDIIGPNTFVGLRHTSVPIYESGTRHVAPSMMDGAIFDIYLRAAVPTTGTWTQGEIIRNSGAATGQPPFWSVETSGTFSAATDNTGDTDGATGVITGMTDTSDFFAGDWVTVSAGFASTGPFRIISKTATSVTVAATSNAVVANVTVATPDPTFQAAAVLP